MGLYSARAAGVRRSAVGESLYLSKKDSYLRVTVGVLHGITEGKRFDLFTDDVSRRTAPADKHYYKANAERECDATV